MSYVLWGALAILVGVVVMLSLAALFVGFVYGVSRISLPKVKGRSVSEIIDKTLWTFVMVLAAAMLVLVPLLVGSGILSSMETNLGWPDIPQWMSNLGEE